MKTNLKQREHDLLLGLVPALDKDEWKFIKREVKERTIFVFENITQKYYIFIHDIVENGEIYYKIFIQDINSSHLLTPLIPSYVIKIFLTRQGQLNTEVK